MNNKGLTLLEMMVVVIIIAGMMMMAYPNYLSSVEKGRASEAIKLVAHSVAAQAKFIAENGTPAKSFVALDVKPSGTERSRNPTVIEGNKITTGNFIYVIGDTRISATPRGSSYNYEIRGDYSEDTIMCEAKDATGQKICSSIGVPATEGNESLFKIE